MEKKNKNFIMNLINTLNILHFGYILPYYSSYKAKRSIYEKPLHYLQVWGLSHINFQTPDLFLWNLVQTFGTEEPLLSDFLKPITTWHDDWTYKVGLTLVPLTSVSLRCWILLYNVIINNMPAMQSFPYLLVWWWQLTNQWSQASEIWKRKRDQKKYLHMYVTHCTQVSNDKHGH